MKKLSNKVFYQRHNDELNRFTYNRSVLHIINSDSKNKISEVTSDKVFLDKNQLIELNSSEKKYEAIILTDIVEVHDDLFSLLSQLTAYLSENGILVISSLNRKYTQLIRLLESLGMKDKNINYSYIQNRKLKNITSGLGFDFITSYSKQIFPFKLFQIGNILNIFLELFLSFFNLGIKTYSVFRIQPTTVSNYKKTIIIPAKNEEGNLEILINRIPKKEKYEIIIPCALSQDNTVEVAKDLSSKILDFNVSTFVQSGKGKANAVWEAAEKASGEVLAILDADISVDPETIPDFFEIIEKNNADFVNGTRLIYPMEKGSMRYINNVGNRAFQLIVGKIINQPLTDSLCGTKVFKKTLLKDINYWQKSTKTKDPFGDFDLLFSAAYSGQKIIEFPIHYRTRIYGETQISRFRDGYKLIKYLAKTYFVFRTSRN